MSILNWLKSKRNSEFRQPEVAPKIAEVDVGLVLKRHYEDCQRVLPNGMIAPYLDAANVPTIGWGNTFYRNGKSVTMDDPPISKDEADALGLWAWEKFKARVAALLPQNAPQKDIQVFTCFAYNVGVNAFHNSSAYRRYVGGDKAGAAEALEWWNKAGGRVLKGLQRRRHAERLTLMGMDPNQAIKEAEKAFP